MEQCVNMEGFLRGERNKALKRLGKVTINFPTPKWRHTQQSTILYLAGSKESVGLGRHPIFEGV